MKKLLFVLTLVSLVGTACSQVTPYAAKVNGEVIEAEVVEEEIKAVTSNPRYAEALEGELGEAGGLRPGGANTVSAQYAVSVVSNRVLGALMGQEMRRLNLEVTPEQRSATETELRGSGENAAIFDSLPDDYRNYLVQIQSQLRALLEARSTPEAQRRYYDENRAKFDQTCFRQLAVADPAVADRFRARIEAGEDFTALAREGANTIDPSGSAASQVETEPRCVTGEQLDQNPFVRDILAAIPVNGVSESIPQQNVVVLVQVTSRGLQSFEAVQASISQTLGDDRQALFDELMRDADIEVNPRYGVYQEPQPANSETGEPAQRGGIVARTPTVLNDGSTSESDAEGAAQTPQ